MEKTILIYYILFSLLIDLPNSIFLEAASYWI